MEHILLSGLSKPFTIPHHSTKTMLLGAIFIVAQKQGVLPVNLTDLFAGLVLAAFAFRITTTYFLAMKVKWNWDDNFLTFPTHSAMAEIHLNQPQTLKTISHFCGVDSDSESTPLPHLVKKLILPVFIFLTSFTFSLLIASTPQRITKGAFT